MAKYNHYAVAKGIDPDTGKEITNKIFTTWEKCQKFIKGVPDAKYKGFYTTEEALAWLRQFAINNETEKEDIVKEYNSLVDETNAIIDQINNRIKSSPTVVDKRFENICEELDVDSSAMLQHFKKQFVETYSLVNPGLPWD